MSVCKYIHSPLAHSSYGDGSGGALSTATGYASSDIGDGSVERFWTSGSSAATHYIAIDFGSASWDTIAVFDVRATDGTAPTKVTIDMGSSMSVWAGVDETITMSTDGDGWLEPTEVPTRYGLLIVTFAASKTLRVGEVFAGTLVALSRQFTDRSDSHDLRLVENESAGGSLSRARVGSERRVLSLAWDALIESERDELAAIWTNAEHGLEPIVLIPDSYNPTDVLHGMIPGMWSERVDDPLWSEIGLDFVQSGRAL